MRLFRSLHAKILFGYCVVGGLFIALVANALFQFRGLEEELARQRQVVVFYDAIRHARRLEKNFLLYLKAADLTEAQEETDVALQTLVAIRNRGPWVDVPDPDMQDIRQYRDLLADLRETSLDGDAPQPLLDKLNAAGSAALQAGEKVDSAASRRVAAALARHHTELLRAIGAALVLALIAGVLVTRSVVRPLRDIEDDLQRVAKGEAGRIDGQAAGPEVESLARSINDTIQELELRQENQARSSRLMALGTMLSGVAHELNNPLSNISSSCQILQEEWEELPAGQAHQLLGQIDQQVLRAQRIVSALLDCSGNRGLRRGNEAVGGLVQEALDLVRHHIPEGVGVHLDIDDGLHFEVDRMRFQQVLVNLVKNAAEAVGAAGAIGIRAWREEAPAERGVSLEVEDDGPGIPPECLKRVFDPFFTTKPVGKGSGLGLSVAYEIIAQHGGALSVDSRPGAGTRFRIHIPDFASHTHE